MTATHAAQLLIGLTMLAYWGRVVRMVYKARRRGRSAGFVPTEPVGRALRLVWQPVVAAWIVMPMAAALENGGVALVRPLVPVGPITAWVAAVVVVVGFLATIICWRRMGKSWRMGINPWERTDLVVTGPYAYVRHPIYALSGAMMLATMVAVPSGAMLGVGAVHVVLLYWEARREEQHLLALHGPPYREYCARVRRFVPAPRWRERDA